MRFWGLVVVVVGVVACKHAEERLHARSSQLVAFDGDGNFGMQPITTTSPPHAFVVAPAAPSDSLQFDRIEAIESTCPEFQVIAPGAVGAIVQRTCTMFGGGGYGGDGDAVCAAFADQTYAFQVVFAPTLELPTSDQCRIIVRLDGGASKSIPVSGLGTPPPFAIDISSCETVDFLTVSLATTSAQRTVTVRNVGSNPQTISATVDLGGGAFEVIGDLTPPMLAPASSTVFQVTCTPASADLFTGSITITTEDEDPRDHVVTIPFLCQGIDHPVQNIDTPEVRATVEEAKALTVQLRNLSVTEPVTGLAVALQQTVPGLSITTPPAATIAPGGSTAVALSWKPTAPFRGALGVLSLSIDGKPPRAISIGMGQALIADVASDVPANEKLDFGRVCIGDSKQRSFRMLPGGTDETVFEGYKISGATATSPFVADVTTAEITVAAEGATTGEILVTSMPMISDGRFEGTVTVTTDSPSEPTHQVPVVVEVLQGGTTVNPPLLDFRSVVVTGFSETKTATFTNCTAGPIEITGIALDGDSAADFDILEIANGGVPQLPPFTVPRGGEIVLAVQMLPQSDGTKQAQLDIDYQESGQPATSAETIALLGEGLLRTPERGSYYRCSTGAPIHAAPVGLVLVFLVVRRRRRR